MREKWTSFPSHWARYASKIIAYLMNAQQPMSSTNCSILPKESDNLGFIVFSEYCQNNLSIPKVGSKKTQHTIDTNLWNLPKYKSDTRIKKI